MTGIAEARPETPSLGSVVSRFGPDSGDVPAYAAVPSLPPNAGELGQSHEPFNAMGDSARLLQLGPDLANTASREEEFQRRVDLLKRPEWRFTNSAERFCHVGSTRCLCTVGPGFDQPPIASLSKTDQESQIV